jgi:L-methionine (R)-S-oxide reductase
VPCDATTLLTALSTKATETRDADALAEALVRALKEVLPQASWVGVYWLEGQELVLGPYVGAATEHTRIPVGQGVCGTAVQDDQDQLVHDVRKVSNYLACSPDVRSELVVLIRCMGRVVGQIDMDSDQLSGFAPDDHCTVKAAADGFAGLLVLDASGKLVRRPG